MSDYKGIYYNEKKDPRYFEGGAHFRYGDLFSALQSLVMSQGSSTHKRTFTFSPNQQTLPKPKTRNVIFYDTKHMHNTNKTNSFLVQKKLLNSNTNKKNTSLEKQMHQAIMNNHNVVSRNSDYTALHKRKHIESNGNANANIGLRKHSLNNSNSSNMILFPKSHYKCNGGVFMKGHTSRNANNNCHTKSLDMNAREFKGKAAYDEGNSNTNDEYEMRKCGCDENARFSIKNMKMKLLKKNCTMTGLNGAGRTKEMALVKRNTNNSVINNNNHNSNCSYKKEDNCNYNNTVIQRRNSYKNVLPRNIKTNSDALFKEVLLGRNGYFLKKGTNGKTVYFK